MLSKTGEFRFRKSEKLLVSSIVVVDKQSRYLRGLEERAAVPSQHRTPQSPCETSIGTVESTFTNPLLNQRPHLLQSENLPRPVYLGDASGIAFSIKLRHLLGPHEEQASLLTQHRYFNHSILSRTSRTNFQLPEKPYAMILVQLVKRFLGEIHHSATRTCFH